MFTRKSVILMAVLLIWSAVSYAERVKDLANVAGVRPNQLIGYGLVVGLSGTGDKTSYADQSLMSMLNKFGINLSIKKRPIVAGFIFRQKENL